MPYPDAPMTILPWDLSSFLPALSRDTLPFSENISRNGRRLSGGRHFLEELRAHRRVEKKKILFVVTTYRREQSALRVLRGLFAALTKLDVLPSESFFLVLEDASEADYSAVREVLFKEGPRGTMWLRASRHLGKAEFWRTYQTAFSCAKALDPDYVLFVQDDLEFDDTFLARAFELFRSLKVGDNGANRPQVMNLYSASDDEPRGRWVNIPRRQVEGLPVRQTQWFDLAGFMLERSVLQELGYWVKPIRPARWEEGRGLSSGVGRQLTRRLRTRAVTYQCFPPLVFHGSSQSEMNPEERARRPLDNRDLRDAGLA